MKILKAKKKNSIDYRKDLVSIQSQREVVKTHLPVYTLKKWRVSTAVETTPTETVPQRTKFAENVTRKDTLHVAVKVVKAGSHVTIGS